MLGRCSSPVSFGLHLFAIMFQQSQSAGARRNQPIEHANPSHCTLLSAAVSSHPRARLVQASSHHVRRWNTNQNTLLKHDLPTRDCQIRDGISMIRLYGAVSAKIRSANTSTPDQHHCGVACMLGLSQIDRLKSHPVTLRRE
jgi:hypothetical protein